MKAYPLGLILSSLAQPITNKFKTTVGCLGPFWTTLKSGTILKELPRALPSWVTFHYALGSLYLYCNRIFKVEGLYTDEQMKLLVMDAFDAERRRFERLANRFSYQAELSPQRPRIPESVRVFVWQHDQGKCARCGSRERLEYDHIIPIVKGGGNTARNIELLCEECNRKKGSSVE